MLNRTTLAASMLTLTRHNLGAPPLSGSLDCDVTTLEAWGGFNSNNTDYVDTLVPDHDSNLLQIVNKLIVQQT